LKTACAFCAKVLALTCEFCEGPLTVLILEGLTWLCCEAHIGPDGNGARILYDPDKLKTNLSCCDRCAEKMVNAGIQSGDWEKIRNLHIHATRRPT
jgi:hypothetical protein